MVKDSPLDEFAVVTNLVSDRVLMRDRSGGVPFRSTLENDFTLGVALNCEDGCTRIASERPLDLYALGRHKQLTKESIEFDSCLLKVCMFVDIEQRSKID